jgi:hypothetical protein
LSGLVAPIIIVIFPNLQAAGLRRIGVVEAARQLMDCRTQAGSFSMSYFDFESSDFFPQIFP